MSAYADRLVDGAIADGMAAFPAILLVGPRSCGKTTSAQRIARSVVRLDDPLEANRFRLGPDAALRAETAPVLIDEWQMGPDVLGAIKRTVDAEPAAGRFIVTGSVQAEGRLPTWPLTGQAQRIRMFGLTEREIAAIHGPGILTAVAEAGLEGNELAITDDGR